MDVFAAIGLFVAGTLLGSTLEFRRYRKTLAELRAQYEYLEQQALQRELEIRAFHETARRAFEAGGTIIIRKP